MYKKNYRLESQLLHAYRLVFPKLEAPFEALSEKEIISEKEPEKEQIKEKIEINNPKKVENSPKEVHEEKDKKEQIVEKTIKKQNKIVLNKQIEEIKKIRVDNTLSKFSKKTLIEIKTRLENSLKELLLNPDYSQSASMLLDGILKAASEENLIFAYKTNRISNLFNENLIKIENTIESALNKKYNLIAVDMDEWDIIKDDFNHKKRPFIYKNETFDIKDILKEEKSDIINMFEDIIEYK